MVISTISFFACVLTMCNSCLLAAQRLRLVFILGIFNGAIYTVINCLVAAASPDQAGVLFLTIPCLWAIGMNVTGLVRLRNEERTRNLALKEN